MIRRPFVAVLFEIGTGKRLSNPVIIGGVCGPDLVAVVNGDEAVTAAAVMRDAARVVVRGRGGGSRRCSNHSSRRSRGEPGQQGPVDRFDTRVRQVGIGEAAAAVLFHGLLLVLLVLVL